MTKEDWDKENDMWNLKEFEDLLLFFKVIKYSIIVDFDLRLRVYIQSKIILWNVLGD